MVMAESKNVHMRFLQCGGPIGDCEARGAFWEIREKLEKERKRDILGN